MNALVAVTIACVLTVVVADTYTSEFDNLDLDAFFQKDDQVEAFSNCLLDESTCTTDKMKHLRILLLDAYNTKCEKCTDKQKELIRKAVTLSIQKVPQQWVKIVKAFDPDGSHKESFTNFMRGE
ncbi:ejaculatory bulb-specific protein 3-like [Periplaneta americana]|uniref:ejaculatory bulb-specific protein 3-like n=1 Tax=Periplaneta americana TaxID=6978 RepID=UPI0037E7DC97